MKEFRFTRDTKQKLWYREYYTIKAETQEEANKKFIQACIDAEDNQDDYPLETSEIKFLEEEPLYDTVEYLNPKDNYGEATVECFTENMDLIWDNNDK